MSETIKMNQYPSLIVDEQGKVIAANHEFIERFAITEKEIKNHFIEETNLSDVAGKFHCLYILAVFCIVKISKEKKHYHIYILLKEDEIPLESLQRFLYLLQEKEQNKSKPQSVNYEFASIIGVSAKLSEVKELAARIAVSSSTVLITGESGTGKELFAQAIHHTSPRRNGPFIAVNCAAIPAELFESEVFGYEEGAFSGAKKSGKPGKIERAQNGTLFLDEISELPIAAQGKLLRVLQEREVERLGSTGKKLVDIRIIAATNKDLLQLVEAGEFRQDLYYRLFVFDLPLPSLKERKEDILPLVHYFMEKYNLQLNKNVKHISPHIRQWFMAHDWPGNIRELKAMVERGVTLAVGNELSDVAIISRMDDRSSHFSRLRRNSVIRTLEDSINEAEKNAIEIALEESEGDKSLAAAKLDIHIASLYRKIAKYQIK